MSEVVRLGDVCRIQNGFAFDSACFTTKSGMPLIRIRDISKGICSVAYDGAYGEEFVVRRGDILVGMDGEFNVAEWSGEPALLNQRVCRLIVNTERLDAGFLFHRIKQDLKKIEDSTPSTTVKHLSSRQIALIELALPPLIEQRQIATRLKAQLAEVETVRQAAQSQAREAELLRRRVLQAAFDELNDEPTTLGRVLTGIQTGKSFQTAEVLARPNELGVLKVSAVSWSNFRAEEAKALKGDYTPAESHKVKQGDLLISRANTKELVGAVVLVERDYPFRLLSDKTLRLLVDESRASKGYLLFALRAELAREHIELYATGTSDSMRNISQDVIASIPLRLPSLDEQHRFATRLKSQLAEAETIAQAVAAQLAEIERLPQRILAQAFAPQGSPS